MSSLSMIKFAIILSILPFPQGTCFWDIGTTTHREPRTDDTPRRSFFRWQWVATVQLTLFHPSWDWKEIAARRRLNRMAGISIDFLCLSTAVILNRRVLLSAYNYMDPYMTRQQDIRIWCLGRTGLHYTPYRYRVHRVMRIVPKSLNPEHCHGPRCIHQPRHDVSIIYSLDQMYIYEFEPRYYHYAYRSVLLKPNAQLRTDDIWFAGSGYEYTEHVLENYKIFYARVFSEDIIDCSLILPKWWGKFICVSNRKHFSGVQNGGGFFSGAETVGTGCFEIRYNNERTMVFTDLRYYYYVIHRVANLTAGEYYEYAYPQWGIKLGIIHDGGGNHPYIPTWQIKNDLYPLG